MSLLTVDDVHTYYGESHILEGVSLAVEEDEVVALIGRNGVGKTTTLRTILQLTPPRRGRVEFHGEDVTGRPTHDVAAMGMGWIPEDRRIFTQLTVEENIRIAVPPGGGIEAGIASMFETFPDLEDHSDQPAGTLSGGQQQMLALARGLVGNNDLLLVDEPSEGLAPLIVETVADSLEAAAEETTLLIVEQNLPLALDLADRFYLLDNGRVVDSGRSGDVSSDSDRLRRHLSA